MMEFSFGGSYRKYKIVQNPNNLIEIDLHNNVTGHKKEFLKVSNPHGTHLRLVANTTNANYNQNKKIKALMMRKWLEFYKGNEMRELSMDEVTTDFLLYVSKSIRDFKLEDLLEE